MAQIALSLSLGPFKKEVFSQTKWTGIGYEVAVCLKTGGIMWTNDPFVASTNDSIIFRNGLSTRLHAEEAVEVDACYGGGNKIKTPGMRIS